MSSHTQQYANKVQEMIAEREEIDLDMVDVKIEISRDGYMEPVVTIVTDNGKFTGKLYDGESYDDIKWIEA
jgi:hypothetical protein